MAAIKRRVVRHQWNDGAFSFKSKSTSNSQRCLCFLKPTTVKIRLQRCRLLKWDLKRLSNFFPWSSSVFDQRSTCRFTCWLETVLPDLAKLQPWTEFSIVSCLVREKKHTKSLIIRSPGNSNNRSHYTISCRKTVVKRHRYSGSKTISSNI